MRLALILSLITSIAAADTYWIPVADPVPNCAVQSVRLVKMELGSAALNYPIRYHGSRPDIRVGIGYTNTVDAITGETNRVLRTESIDWPYLVVDEGAVAACSTEQQAVIDAALVSNQQAEFNLSVQKLMEDHGANVDKFFAALAHFPAITLPTTYDAALDAMHKAIMDAQAGDKRDALDSQSRIAQDIYKRILEPQGWTGIKLAQLAQALQGGQ